MTKHLWLVLVALLSVLIVDRGRGPSPHVAPGGSSSSAGSAAGAQGATRLGQLPMRFEENAGQLDERVRFVARRGGASLFLTDDGATLALRSRSKGPEESARVENDAVLSFRVAGGRKVAPRPSATLETKTSYFVGSDPSKWRTNIASHGRVTYPGVLDGVDVVYHGEEGQLEYDLVVAPGADARAVAMEIDGANGLSITKDGDLAIHTERGELLQPKPRVFQRDAAGREREVVAAYRVLDAKKVGFELSAYDADRELVIDPIIAYGTYLGGSGFEQLFGQTLAVDATGAMYVTGLTDSSDFPTANAAQPATGGNSDGFVAKLNPAGTALVYATYLGGNGNDRARAIAVDATGAAYVMGLTQSANFPLLAPAQGTFGGGTDMFVTKLSPAGTIVYSTYIGGSSTEEAWEAIAVDGTGHAYVGGRTTSPDLPVTSGAFQTSLAGGTDAFVAKLSAAGSAFVYATYVGGSADDYGGGIAVDAGGSAYLVGGSSSPNFPTTPGAFQTSFAGNGDAYLVKLNATGTGLVYGTFLGGASIDEGWGVAVDSAGNAFVVGHTASYDFPTQAPFQASQAGSFDGFVTKLNATGSAIVYSTYIGGSEEDFLFSGIGLDASGSVSFGAHTHSSNYPLMLPIQAADTSPYWSNAVTKLGPDGSLAFSTYLGGSGDEIQHGGVAVDPAGNLYVSGTTESTDFPTLNPFQPTNHGNFDAFVVKIIESAISIAPASATVPPRGTQSFAGIGGSGGFTYAVTVDASGGATIDSAGNYHAGPVGGVVDQVEVTDSGGAKATANVTVTAGVSITPSSIPTTPPRGASIQLAASGGSGTGFVWSMAAAPSGGSVSATGLYTPGSTGGPVTDRVRVTDSLGNVGEVAIPIGLGIAISPASPSAPPRGEITFSATGGSNAGYTWSSVALPSGGSITAAGVYRAGSTGSVSDVVRVTDSLGNTADATVSVTAGLAISPAGPNSAPPRGTIDFGVSGGSGSGYSWAITTNGSLSATVDGNGLYRAGTTGNVSDVVTVTDSFGNTASRTITVTAGLTATPASASVAPRGSVDLDTSGGSNTGIAWSFVTNASGASLGVGTGLYTAGSLGDRTDTVRATDSLGNTVDVTITVGPGITIAPGTASTPPRGTIAFEASGGSNAGFVWSVSNNHSGATIDATTGSYRAGTTGNVTDTVRVQDSLGNFAVVNVSVGGGLAVNPAAASTPPRGSVDFDVSGGSGTGFVWSMVTSASGGSIAPATGLYQAGSTGSVTDTVRVTDSLGNTVTIDVQVTAALAIAPMGAAIAPLGTVDFDATGGSGAGLVWSLVTHPSGGTIAGATGLYTAGSTGSVTDTVRVTDSLGNTATANVTVSASLALTPATVTVPPRGTRAFTASGGAGSYAFTLTTNASGGNVSSTGGAYTAGATGSVTDVLVVQDANGASASSTITVGPGVTLTPSTPSVAPSASIAFQASGGSDTGFTFALSTNGSGGTIDASSGAYTAGPTGDATDTVTVTDSLGNTATVDVSVGGALVVAPAAPVVAQRGALAFTATGGAGGYVWSLDAAPSGGTIDVSTGAYKAGATGSVTDVVKVTDSVGTSVTVNVKVGAPLALSPPVASVAPGGSITFTISGGSGTGLVLSLDPNGSGGKIASTGIYTAGSKGGTTDTIKVKDDLGNTASATVTVTTVAPPPSPDAGAPDGGSSGGATPPSPTRPTLEGGGCGCVEAGAGTGNGLASIPAIGVVVLAALRRRRSSRRTVQ